MRHLCAREIQQGGKGIGKYHYTIDARDGVAYAIGFCSPHDPCICKRGTYPFEPNEISCQLCNDSGLVDKKDPCPGHDTKEGACQHYKDYLLSIASINGPKTQEWPKVKCDVPGCNIEGTMLLTVPGRMSGNYEVCPEHATIATLATLFEVGESWES